MEISKIEDFLTLPFKRVAFFSGSFDPIHKGHLRLIENALNCVDVVVICPHSHNKNKLLSPINDRIEIIKMMLNKEPLIRKIYICRPSFLHGIQNNEFVQIVDQLKKQGFIVFILIGQDSLNANYFAKNRVLPHIVHLREGTKVNIEQILTGSTIIFPNIENISSTQVRDLIANGIKYYDSDEINSFIIKKGLYGSK